MNLRIEMNTGITIVVFNMGLIKIFKISLKRDFEFLDEQKTKNYSSVLVVAHSGVSKAFSGYFEGIQDGKFVYLINNKMNGV